MIEFNVREIARAMEAQSASAAAAAALHLPARDLPAQEEKRTLGPLAAAVALQKFAPALSHVVLAGFVRAADFLVIAGLGLLVYAIYVVPLDGFEWHYVTTILAIATTAVLAFQWADIYDVGAFRSRVEQLSRIGFTLTIVFLFVLAVAFFAKYQGMYSRVWVSTWYGGTVLLLFAGRTFLSVLVRRWTREGRMIRRTVIVGGAKAGEALIDALRAQKDSDLSICGIFDDRNDDRSPPQVAGVAKLGTVDELVEFARRTRIDLLLVSIPITAEERVLQMVKKLWVLPIDLRLAAHTSRLRFRPRAYSYIGNVPVLDVHDKPLTDWNYVVKWLFDRIVGGLLLLASAPLMALVAIAIKLDSKGPVFFRQKRYGFNNELIEVFKFRSMYVDKTDANAARLVTKDDARVTRVGRFIRKSSLDELPQLLNVAIKGNLSLVGPRPHAVYAKAQNQLYDEVVDGYFARHRVKPGITGWAQVNGWRGETNTGEKIQRRVEHDLFYIENWSVLFDLYILARTPFALLKTENAY